MASVEKRARTRAWPFSLNFACSAGSFRTRRIAVESAGASRIGHTRPVTSCSIASGMPPASVPTTGAPAAMASSTLVPSPSMWLGMTNRSSALSRVGMSVRKPGKRTAWATPSDAARAWSSSLSSPSPTIAQVTSGRAARIAGMASIR
jgi:hypothetical protein